MNVVSPGVCGLPEDTGAILSCEIGFDLTDTPLQTLYDKVSTFRGTSDESCGKDDTSSLICADGHEVLRRRLAKKSKGEGKEWKCAKFDVIPQLTMTKHKGSECPAGYQQTIEGCTSLRVVSPDVVCPQEFTMYGKLINPDAFRGKEYVRCGRELLYKGITMCPNGFELANMPYPDYNFGDSIPVDEVNKQIPHASYHIGIDAIVECIQIVAVLSHHCRPMACSGPYLQRLSKTVRDWGYYQLELDPELVEFEAIPSGKNLEFSKRGVTTPY